MTVPFLDLAAIHAPLEARIRAAIDGVLTSQRYILGGEVTAFEREIAAYLGVEHAVGVSSGSDALVVALLALGIGAGDEVITTPWTFVATGEAIARIGGGIDYYVTERIAVEVMTNYVLTTGSVTGLDYVNVVFGGNFRW